MLFPPVAKEAASTERGQRAAGVRCLTHCTSQRSKTVRRYALVDRLHQQYAVVSKTRQGFVNDRI